MYRPAKLPASVFKWRGGDLKPQRLHPDVSADGHGPDNLARSNRKRILGYNL
jgi:hypothetical protein